MVWLLRYEHVWQLMSPYAFDGGCNHERGLSFFWILWLNRSSMKNQRPPPMSGLSLLSYPSSRLLRMCVTSLSYTLGVSTHVLLDTSSSSSVWKELQGERRKKMHAINYCFQRESRHRLQWDLLFLLFFFYTEICGDEGQKESAVKCSIQGQEMNSSSHYWRHTEVNVINLLFPFCVHYFWWYKVVSTHIWIIFTFVLDDRVQILLSPCWRPQRETKWRNYGYLWGDRGTSPSMFVSNQSS